LPEEATLGYYVFDWVRANYAIALGNGSLFNHSYEPNVVYLMRTRSAQIWFQTVRDIEAGEELTINYNGDPDDQSMVHFLDKKRATSARGNG
jgi:SET domain-containing protein